METFFSSHYPFSLFFIIYFFFWGGAYAPGFYVCRNKLGGFNKTQGGIIFLSHYPSSFFGVLGLRGSMFSETSTTQLSQAISCREQPVLKAKLSPVIYIYHLICKKKE